MLLFNTFECRRRRVSLIAVDFPAPWKKTFAFFLDCDCDGDCSCSFSILHGECH